MGSYVGIAIAMSVYLYTSAYIHARNRLKGSGIPDVTLKIKQIRLSCFLMTTSFFVCYIPAMTLVVASSFMSTKPFEYYKGNLLWFLGGTLPLALDSTITPILVLYFRKDLRQVLAVQCGVVGVGSSNDADHDDDGMDMKKMRDVGLDEVSSFEE
ncbi:UNVERIFIED_CONTAM: hypothetical protein HDU68_004164 [Siphonaria sp. JEL0065]|nr:hypothetical protein HDU68_004164 [Siphonaria sp. JEL0065]